MFLAYYDHFSIISIVILVLVLFFAILGYKLGFLTKFIKMANALCGFVFSLLFCSKLSNAFVYKIWGDGMADSFAQNFKNKTPEIESTSDLLRELGLPGFIANNVDINLSLDSAYTRLGETCAKFVCVLISFCILFFGVTIICFLLKLLVAGIRKVKIVRILDGILGIIFYEILFYLFICVVMVILSFVMQSNGLDEFETFIINDFGLNNDGFRVSKELYQNNLIGNFFKIFF